jgi:hypothetical protein
MKTATLLIYTPFQTGGICVAVIYRRNQLQDFLGHPSELQSLIEKAIIYLENQKFTRLKVNGKIFNFKDFLMKGTA